MNERSIFVEALEKTSPTERAAYLEAVCGEDAAGRRRVEKLLAAHEAAGGILDRPPAVPDDATGAYTPISEGPGTVIGPYKLLQKIGEGGFGAVYMAEQEKPVRRMVALKIIKPGMDTAQVIARFESERQALALMDHPNIATVLDAGATGGEPGGVSPGKPFFVMELVKGVPITEFCDKNHMPAGARLKLFLDVCNAIQHAHHKGIIHRDIKPSNVMVTLHDGVPVVKVIDFGVAKATVQRLTERTLFTAYGQMVGTPAYMSPEQAEMSGLDIDTRSDIYSLGVLLYELLTGTTPLEGKNLREAGYIEMQRLIREEEAPRPSTRLSSLGGSATILASNRGTDPTQLARLLAGDLDWIIMKSLDKDRNRRYDSPVRFAEDIVRYLHQEAILARPPSTAYQLKKFAQRNRAAVVTAAAVAAALLVGTAVATGQAVRASRAEVAAREAETQARQDRADADEQRQVAERREADARDNERKALAAEAAAKESDATANAVLDFVKSYIFAAARPPFEKVGLGREITLRKALDAAEPKIAAAFASRPRVEAQLRSILGDTYLQLGEGQVAEAQIDRAYGLAKEHYGLDDSFTAHIEYQLAAQYCSSGRSAQGFRLLEQSLDRRRRTLGLEHPVTVSSLANLVSLYRRNSDRRQEARKLGEELLQVTLKQDRPSEDAGQIQRLASAYSFAGRTDKAARVLEEALPKLTSKLGPDNSQILLATFSLAAYYVELDRKVEALAKLEPAYQRAVRALGPTNVITLRIMQNLSAYLAEAGRGEDSARMLEAALPDLRRELGPTNPHLAPHVINLSEAYIRLGRYRDGVKLLEETIAAVPEKDRVAYVNLDFILDNLADAYRGLGDLSNATRVLTDYERYSRSQYPADSLELASRLVILAKNLLQMDQFAEAERVLREAFNVRKSREPDGYRVSTAKVLLGRALAGQKRFSDAEPFLVGGCEELTARQGALPPAARETLEQAGRTLAILCARTDRPDKAIEVCRQGNERSNKLNRSDTASLYNAAAWRSVAAAAIKSTSGADAPRLANVEADRGMARLNQAVAAGYRDVARIKIDHDLDALRDREDFKKLLAELETAKK